MHFSITLSATGVWSEKWVTAASLRARCTVNGLSSITTSSCITVLPISRRTTKRSYSLALLSPLDVYGAGFDAPGRGKLDNEKHSIEFRWDSKEGALTNKFTFDSQAKTWTSLIRQVEKGEWKTFAEEKWTKK